jgi:hypothetical protein
LFISRTEHVDSRSSPWRKRGAANRLRAALVASACFAVAWIAFDAAAANAGSVDQRHPLEVEALTQPRALASGD